MFGLTLAEIYCIGLSLEGIFYGLYSGIFAIYLQCQASNQDTTRTHNMIFYLMCSLYVLSVVVFVCDIADSIFTFLSKRVPDSVILGIAVLQTTSFGCCDFIAQLILIYRCWIVWGYNIRVVIIPSILAFAFFGTWLAAGSSVYISSDDLAPYIFSDKLVVPVWAYSVNMLGLALSLTVNALVTGLIVFRIFKVFREVKAHSEDKILGTNDGSKIRCTMFILIESGMALFSIQLARFVVTMLRTEATYTAFHIIVSIHEMVNGITPTIILVRTSMGLSFHDEKSMEELAIGSLRFAPNNRNSALEMDSISIVGQDSRDDDIGVQRSSDIDIIER